MWNPEMGANYWIKHTSYELKLFDWKYDFFVGICFNLLLKLIYYCDVFDYDYKGFSFFS